MLTDPLASSNQRQVRQSKKGTLSQALRTFFTPIVGVIVFRWLLFEPFVIPSGSMIPTLLVHDHIFVSKMAFGIRMPSTDGWLWRWGSPERGDVVVFKYPKNPDVFYIKRIVAIGGDEISMNQGVLQVNGVDLPQVESAALYSGENDESDYDYFSEKNHIIRYRKGERSLSEMEKVTVPEGQLFAMGDNRDQSSDSRVWGFVPEQNIVGRPTFIWLSCEKTLSSAQFLCDPQSIHWSRLFARVF